MIVPRGRGARVAVFKKALLLARRGSHLALNLCDHPLKAGHFIAHSLQSLVLGDFGLEQKVGQRLWLTLSKLLHVELSHAEKNSLETLIDILLEAELGGHTTF